MLRHLFTSLKSSYTGSRLTLVLSLASAILAKASANRYLPVSGFLVYPPCRLMNPCIISMQSEYSRCLGPENRFSWAFNLCRYARSFIAS
ncbi:hypothetical protein BKA69DRAFT_1057112 [Paraphysoderma sedebokerense]|nr:hypothetical protein BKA69DRAFT_1057112 [Paraphysoderma sedebokerense]